MKKMLIKMTALILVALFLLSGCKFVVKENKVLLNPTESTSTSASTSASTPTSTSISSPISSPTSATDSAGGTTTAGQAGGSTKATSTVQTHAEPKLSGKLEVQVFTNESEACSDAWTYILNSFEREAGVKVTAYIGSQVNSQLSKRWMGNNPPDIALLDGSGIPVEALETSGALYDLTDTLKNGYVYGTNEKIWDVTNHEIHERLQLNGKYHRAAIMGAAYGVMYDSVFVKELGVTVPGNYTQLKSFVSAVKAKGSEVFTTSGSSGNYATWSMVMPALAAYGQSFFDEIQIAKKIRVEKGRG